MDLLSPGRAGNCTWVLTLLALCVSCSSPHEEVDPVHFESAAENGRWANQGFRRSLQFVQGWLQEADPASGLIPRNLRESRDIWNAQDSAADNYPFMVLTAALLDRSLYEGRMTEMLRAEMELTSRLGALPDTYSFSKKTFLEPNVDLAKILFGSSEYVKDGLLALTEWLGPSPWSERMTAIVDEMWARAPVDTPYGRIVSDNVEINGEMLQVLSRLFWMTGEQRYLEWAIRLGDYYLLGNHHPTADLETLRLRDHGCEIVSGLTELYATVASVRPEKKRDYQQTIHSMLDRILEVGRNEHGLFYNSVHPGTGEVLNAGIADTFGYTFNGFYTVYLVDGREDYRDAVVEGLSNLNQHYREFDWEHGSADGYADAVEGALNLYQREPIASVGAWIDSQILVMWAKQQPSGIIEGWHGDGNFARTSLMFCLWKTAGLTIRPWRQDVVFGAVRQGDALLVSLTAEKSWTGQLLFDSARHRTQLNLPLDWPRINQFPEWYPVQAESRYSVRDLASGTTRMMEGQVLIDGLPVALEPGRQQRLVVEGEPR